MYAPSKASIWSATSTSPPTAASTLSFWIPVFIRSFSAKAWALGSSEGRPGSLGAEWLHVDYEAHLTGFYAACGFTPAAGAALIDLTRLEIEES